MEIEPEENPYDGDDEDEKKKNPNTVAVDDDDGVDKDAGSDDDDEDDDDDHDSEMSSDVSLLPEQQHLPSRLPPPIRSAKNWSEQGLPSYVKFV